MIPSKQMSKMTGNKMMMSKNFRNAQQQPIYEKYARSRRRRLTIVERNET
jgi:hypothetical protein